MDLELMKRAASYSVKLFLGVKSLTTVRSPIPNKSGQKAYSQRANGRMM
jgi:hypothetical protein